MSSLQSPAAPGEPSSSGVDSFERALAVERRARVDQTPDWRPWMAPVALLGGLVLAAVGGLIVDLPAAAFGVSITAKHIPGWLEILDTVVQDLAFVLVAVLFARMGGRTVRAWQFGLRPPRLRMLWVVLLPLGLLIVFLIFSVIWAGILDEHTKEKILEQLGANEGALLLLLSAALTCVVAPICEELLFRGFIFTAAAQLEGDLAGGDHHGVAVRRRARRLGAGGRPRAARVPRVWVVPAVSDHRLAVSVHRGALVEQLDRLRQPRELDVPAGARADRGLAAADLGDRADGQARRPDHGPAGARRAGSSGRRERVGAPGARRGPSPRAHRIVRCEGLASFPPPRS